MTMGKKRDSKKQPPPPPPPVEPGKPDPLLGGSTSFRDHPVPVGTKDDEKK